VFWDTTLLPSFLHTGRIRSGHGHVCYKSNWSPIFTRVAAGDPGTEIVCAANEMSAGLIVLGAHDYPFRLPFGEETTAYKVLVSAPYPVLTLKGDSPAIRKWASAGTKHMVAL
jgi:hypothetical protein